MREVACLIMLISSLVLVGCIGGENGGSSEGSSISGPGIELCERAVARDAKREDYVGYCKKAVASEDIEACKGEIRTECIMGIAVRTKDKEVCNKLSGPMYDYCLYLLGEGEESKTLEAMITKNSSKCYGWGEGILNGEILFSPYCMRGVSWVAETSEDCSGLEHFDQIDCIIDVAVRNHDISLCRKTGASEWKCNNAVAFNYGEKEHCHYLARDHGCEAAITGNLSFCETGIAKNYCYRTAATYRRDKSICANLEDEEDRQDCIEEVEKIPW
ncbi:MAG: hypothetical protein J7L23_05430 [Candidatus Diapherotrites archaeon]|nr:hypothetical protein [Candidatus Diapherotrites archaeon]